MKWYVLVLLILTPNIYAATLEGNVYDYSLNKISSVVSVNSTPNQKIVAEDGYYSFSLKPGNYELKAESFKSREKIIEKIVIVDDNSYSLDLILFTIIEDEVLPHLDIDLPEKDNSLNFWFFGLTIFVLLLLLVYAIYKSKQKKVADNDGDKENLLKFVQQERRTTQKEIRLKFPSSEAKISLILTQLENEGKIKKIKKGRGNVIIYNG